MYKHLKEWKYKIKSECWKDSMCKWVICHQFKGLSTQLHVFYYFSLSYLFSVLWLYRWYNRFHCACSVCTIHTVLVIKQMNRRETTDGYRSDIEQCARTTVSRWLCGWDSSQTEGMFCMIILAGQNIWSDFIAKKDLMWKVPLWSFPLFFELVQGLLSH